MLEELYRWACLTPRYLGHIDCCHFITTITIVTTTSRLHSTFVWPSSFLSLQCLYGKTVGIFCLVKSFVSGDLIYFSKCLPKLSSNTQVLHIFLPLGRPGLTEWGLGSPAGLPDKVLNHCSPGTSMTQHWTRPHLNCVCWVQSLSCLEDFWSRFPRTSFSQKAKRKQSTFGFWKSGCWAAKMWFC